MSSKPEYGVCIAESLVRMIAMIGFLVLFFLNVIIQRFFFAGFGQEPQLELAFWIIWFTLSIPFFILAIGSFFLSSWLIKRKHRAMTPLNEVHPEISDMINEASQAERLGKVPESYIMDSEEPICHVFGRTAKEAKLVISQKLVDLLTPIELRAAILHELAHILNRDMSFMTWGITFVKALKYWFATLILVLLIMRLWIGAYIDMSVSSGLIFLFLLFVSVPTILVNSVSRIRESLADARASLYIENKSDLFSAIIKTEKENVMISIVKMLSRRGIRHTINKVLSFKWMPYFLKKHTIAHHPSLKDRRSDLIDEKYLIKKGKLYLISIETSIYAGVIAFYFLIGSVLWSRFLPSYLVGLIPIAIVVILNNFSIKYSDIEALFDHSSSRTQTFYLLGLIARNIISCATTFLIILALFLFSGTEFPIEAWVFVYIIYIMISIIFSLIYLAVKYPLAKIKQKQKG
ncbi:MAG: M48 family metalloprotease [Candidatus Bathyarchaeia archaeon]